MKSGEILRVANNMGSIKEKALSYLKPRSEIYSKGGNLQPNKLRGLKATTLKSVGHEVLIRTVIMVIATYAMSVFKLSTS